MQKRDPQTQRRTVSLSERKAILRTITAVINENIDQSFSYMELVTAHYNENLQQYSTNPYLHKLYSKCVFTVLKHMDFFFIDKSIRPHRVYIKDEEKLHALKRFVYPNIDDLILKLDNLEAKVQYLVNKIDDIYNVWVEKN